MLPRDEDLTPEERREVDAARASCDRYAAAAPPLFQNFVAWAATAPQDSDQFDAADVDLAGALMRGTSGVTGMGSTWFPVVEAVRLLREALLAGARGPTLNSYFAQLETATHNAAKNCRILVRTVPELVHPPVSR